MISVAICEDSRPVQAHLEALITGFLPEFSVDVFSSGEDLLACLSREKIHFSVYLMDISLPGLSGIETAAAIRREDPYALLIYITDYKEYVYQVFETLPFRFIPKPVDEAVFQKVLADALNYLENRTKLFHFHIERRQYQVPLQEILYFESRLRQISLHTMETVYEFYGKLSEISSSLDELLFVRVHTSYIVNMEYILSLGDTSLILRSGAVIPVSKRYRKELRTKHLQYLKWRAHQ